MGSSKKLLLAVFALNWLVLNALPFVLTPTYSELLWWRHLQQVPVSLTLVFCSLAAWIMFEFILLMLAFGGIKSLVANARTKTTASVLQILALLLFLICSTYFAALISSWILFQTRGIFLSAQNLNLALFLKDQAVSRLFTSGDLIIVLLGAGVPMLLAAAFWCWAPTWTCRRKVKLSALAALIFFGIHLTLGIAPRYLENSDNFARVKDTAQNFVSPRLSLFGANLLFGSSPKHVEPIELSLANRYTNEEYYLNVTKPARKPNFIVLIVEGMRADVINLQHQGQEVVPTINEMAKDGHYFNRAYSQSPETDYSMISILTSLYPLRSPYRELNFKIDYPVTRIYDVLKVFGYRTALFASLWVSTHRLLDSPALDKNSDPRNLPIAELRAGVNEVDREKVKAYSASIGDRYSVDQLKSWIKEKNNSDEPFAIFLYLFTPHFSYPLPELGEEIFKPTSLDKSPSFLGYPAEIVPVMLNRYYNTLRYTDSLIHEFKEYIAAQGLAEDTMWFVTGDHGQMFNEHHEVAHSGPLYEEAIHVPLVVWPKENFVPTFGYDKASGLVDISPTILSILGLPPHENFQGKALLQSELAKTEQNSDSKSNTQRPIFSSIQVFSFEDSIIKWPWKYSINQLGHPDRFYNLEEDPTEQNNLLQTKPEVENELKNELQLFRQKQLYYYSDESPYKQNFFPPQH